jgi:hypothetical protein
MMRISTGPLPSEPVQSRVSNSDPRAQVITSAGMGSAAAIAINADLVHDDVGTLTSIAE